jgi:hypothetical protein
MLNKICLCLLPNALSQSTNSQSVTKRSLTIYKQSVCYQTLSHNLQTISLLPNALSQSTNSQSVTKRSLTFYKQSVCYQTLSHNLQPVSFTKLNLLPFSINNLRQNVGSMHDRPFRNPFFDSVTNTSQYICSFTLGILQYNLQQVLRIIIPL